MDVVVSRGDPFNLTCAASGTPTPTIIWVKDDLVVGNADMVGDDLLFEEALPGHAGIYVCIAESGGLNLTASATVTVNCKSAADDSECVV